jgi:NAD(P)-dependent dehydrogenase (short-subunit alcohol dehydrogenase family)
MKTILITGCSSGYGLEIARYFHRQGWNVIATMRTPKPDLFAPSSRLRVLALDVTDEKSIAAAIKAAGRIDVLVNNAGIGLLGAFEATPMATVREVFETNTFGTMAMVQAVLPQMRESGWHDHQRNLKCDAGTISTGRALYGEQDRDRRVHRITRAGAGGIQCSREAGRARLRS